MSAWSDAVAALSPFYWYRLSEASGTTLTDASGNARTGSMNSTDGITFGTASLVPGGADNTSKTLANGTPGLFSPTIAVDVRAITHIVTMKSASSGARGNLFEHDGENQRLVLTGTNASIQASSSQSVTLSPVYPSVNLFDNVAHLVMVVVRATSAELWVDGVMVGSGSHAAGAGNVTKSKLKNFFSNPAGIYDEWVMFDRALTTTEIGNLYAGWTGVPGAGTITLAGTLATKTASFAIATVVAASLVGTLQPKTAAFEVDAAPFGNVELAGTLAAKTAAFTVDLPVRNVELSGELARKTASVDLLADAQVSLAGSLRTKTAALTLDAVPVADRLVSLSGSMRRKTSAITLASNPAVRLAATLRARTSAFSIDAQPTAWLAGTLQPKLATFTIYVVTPVTPSPVVGAQSVVVARAFGPVTMQGTQPVYTISSAYIPRARQRILVNNVDVTYFRGGITPDIPYTLVEPLLYGPATLEVPQVAACFERIGYGELSFLRPGAPVEVQRVIDDVVVGTDYKGLVVAWDISGRNLSVELGGYGQGRAALRNRQSPIFARINDIGRQIADSITDLGLPHYPHLGAETGIESMTMGGTGHLEHIQALVAKAWTRSGRQWTVMPDESTGVYETHRKDDTTIHGTVFLDDARTVANLRRDIAEEPNRIYATGVTPRGKRVRFGVYPGLIQGPTPDFPGHMELGDTGDGVRLLIGKLHATGYLKLTDAAGGYDQDVYDAVVDLQNDAGLFDEGFVTPAVPGEVGIRTWEALYDLGVTGNSLEWSHIEPAAQRRKVRPWNRSATGGIMGVNPLHDPNHLVRDRNVEINGNRSQMREFSRAALHDSDDPNWVGDITFNAGALLRGAVAIGATITAANVMDARELRPGMNLTLPQFDGGTFVHIAAIQVDGEGIVTATVDTRFRDAMEVWEVIARNKESRNDPARQRNQKHRSSTIVKDSIGEIDEIGGVLPNDIPLKAGWNVFDSIAAAEGTMSRLRLMVGDASTVVIQGDGDETIIENLDGQEFACAVFGRSITADRLNNLIPEPLTVAGTKMWETKRADLKERWLLYSAGTHDEPCGYSPGRKHFKSVEAEEPNPDYDPATDPDSEKVITVTTQESWGEVTGKHVDDAGFAYRSETRTAVHVAVWVRNPATLLGGRIMWPQLEAGA